MRKKKHFLLLIVISIIFFILLFSFNNIDTGFSESVDMTDVEVINNYDSWHTLEQLRAITEEEVYDIYKLELEREYINFKIIGSNTYTLRTTLVLTNNSSMMNTNIVVKLPGIENNYPVHTSHEIIDRQGRLYSLNVGSMSPGESVKVYMDFKVKAVSTKLTYNHPDLNRIYEIYNNYKDNSINCRTATRRFVTACKNEGFQAREVIGYKRPAEGNMAKGNLSSCRHSWAEVSIEDQWIPIDLSFYYFGSLPHMSHIFESYYDLLVDVTWQGGEMSATWHNEIL